MQIAELEESISQTNYILKMNSQLNSSYLFLYNKKVNFQHKILDDLFYIYFINLSTSNYTFIS